MWIAIIWVLKTFDLGHKGRSKIVSNGYNGEIIGFVETYRGMSEYKMTDGDTKPIYDIVLKIQ